MKKLSSKSLSLNVSTLRVLTETTLRGIAGGATGTCLPPKSDGCFTENKYIVTVK